MEKLPNELLEVIFGFTDQKTKLGILCVCKRFNQIISKSLTLMEDVGSNLTVNFEKVNWKDGLVSDGRYLLDLNVLLESQRRYQHIKMLNLQTIPTKDIEARISTIVHNMGQHLRDLTIEATQINFKCLSEMTKKFRQLKNVKFILACKEYYFMPGTFEMSFDVEDMHLFLNNLETMRNLELEFFCHYNLSRDIFPRDYSDVIRYQLESFKVNRIQLNQNFLNFLLMQTRLQHLDISSSFFSPGTTLNDLFAVLVQLKDLKSVNLQIYGVTAVTDEQHLFSGESKIKSLSCMILTHTEESHKEFYLKKFIESMSNLESLKFSTEYTEPRKLDWINHLQKLRTLELIDCKPDVLQYIYLDHLETLKIQMGPIQNFTKNLANLWISFFERHPHIRILHLNGLPIDKNFLLHFCKVLSDLESLSVEISDAETAKLILEFFHKLKFAKLFLNDNISDEIENLFMRSSFNVNRTFHYLECMKS